MDERDREDNRLREWGFGSFGDADVSDEHEREEQLAAETARQQAAQAMQGAMTRGEGVTTTARPAAKRATRAKTATRRTTGRKKSTAKRRTTRAKSSAKRRTTRAKSTAKRKSAARRAGRASAPKRRSRSRRSR